MSIRRFLMGPEVPKAIGAKPPVDSDPVKTRLERHNERLKTIEQTELQAARLFNMMAHKIRALEEQVAKLNKVLEPGKWAN